MANYNPIYIPWLRNLQLRVHVIGYHPQGECILLVIYDNENRSIKYSIVIDSYKKRTEENQLFTLLEEYGISSENPIDMLIWTHPDRDHSRGIPDIIEKYVCSTTRIIMPDGANKWTIQKKYERKLYQTIINRLKNRELSFDRVNVHEQRASTMKLVLLKFHDNISEDIYFSIEVLTPFSDDVAKKTEGNGSFLNNDISMSIIIQIGDLQLFFGGDIENNAIERIPLLKMDELSFVKIPHHGSNTSTKLPEHLLEIFYPQSEVEEEENNNDEYDACYGDDVNEENEEEMEGGIKPEQPHIISVSTCFRLGKARDPLKDVLELYKPFSKRICLTDHERPRKNHYGVWTFVYNVVDSICVDDECRCKGDAGVWYKYKR